MDTHHARTGQWPNALDGTIVGARGETWMHVDGALAHGRRGLPGGMSLEQLLVKHRGFRPAKHEANLTTQQILGWADAYHMRNGEWPSAQSGAIPQTLGESWYRIQIALKQGRRGLPGGSSLARLLQQERDVRNKSNLQRLTVRQILKWADAHHNQTGKWPTRDSGVVLDGDGTTWMAIQDALYLGGRGLRGGNSLARLLGEQRDVRNIQRLPDLRIASILEWADVHHERTGVWPIRESGEIVDTGGENWGSIDHALKVGSRGLEGKTTLAKLLAEQRGKRNLRDLPPLIESEIRTWAVQHFERTGRWPSQTTGPILDAPGEKWRNVDTSLYKGLRGLPGGSSLAQLLKDKKKPRPVGRKKKTTSQ